MLFLKIDVAICVRICSPKIHIYEINYNRKSEYYQYFKKLYGAYLIDFPSHSPRKHILYFFGGNNDCFRISTGMNEIDML